MSTVTVHPEPGRLLEGVCDETLVALIERGDHTERREAREEQYRRGIEPFKNGVRVKATKPFSTWLGTVEGPGYSREFPISVRWDNGVVESLSPDELEVIPANVIAFDRKLGEGRN
jgi:hypothetical protein